MKTERLLIAIDRASTVVKFLTWAIQEEDPQRKLEWIKEANFYTDDIKHWISKEFPF